jgi:16S rRNA (cytosine967-C5)-methyltransferase
MKKVSEHRIFVHKALGLIDDGAHADALLQGYPNQESRALAQNLLLGVLRWRGSIDDLMRQLVKKNPKRVIRNILRLAFYELFFCKTPNHAVIDQAVELCSLIGKPHNKGFVNAVLRKASSKKINKEASLNLPLWLYKRWKKYPEWIELIQKPQNIYICFQDDTIHPEYELNTTIVNNEKVERVYLPTNMVGSPVKWPHFEAGKWWIMNPCAAYAMDLAWNSLGCPKSFSVLDTCAAPGGKSFRLASRGGKIVATDVSMKRIERLEQNINRMNWANIDVKQHNWVQPNTTIGHFDMVVVDAPCSGTGVLRKHPEIKWRRTYQDVQALVLLQKRIIQNAAKHVRKGGVLVYCVCSLLEEEGLPVVKTLSWKVIAKWSNLPPADNEDGFQVYVLEKE